MSDKVKQPAVRFVGHTNDWEQREFQEIAGRVSVMSNQNNLPRVEYEDIISGTGELNKDIFAKESSKSGILFSQGDVLYGKLRPYLKNWLLPNFHGIAVGDFWVLRPIDVDCTFMYRLIQSRQFEEVANQSTGTKMPRADWKLVATTTFLVPPSIAEQSKIGAFFSNLDDLITLHQRKYDKLVNVKKSLLDKMFPKKGAVVPEVRFAGFTDAWEQRKLGEVCGSLEYGLNAAAKEYDGENKYIRITDIDDDTRLFLTSDLTSPDTNLKDAARYRLEAGDIVFARTGASVGKSYIYKRSDGTVYYAGFLIRAKVKQEYSADFVFQNTLSQNYEKYILITSQRSGQPGVNAQEYAEYTFSVPEYEEQKKIGTFLTSLDRLITLHQRKLEKLENIKKAFLEKIFI